MGAFFPCDLLFSMLLGIFTYVKTPTVSVGFGQGGRAVIYQDPQIAFSLCLGTPEADPEI